MEPKEKEIKTTALWQLSTSLTSLFDSEEDSDFTIKCGHRTWNLHRMVLRAGSPYFKTECDKDKFKEGIEAVVVLKEEDDPRLIGMMLRFLYSHDYNVEITDKSLLVVHAEMYAKGEFYGIPLLKDLAREKFIRELHSKELVDIASFASAIEVIFNETISSDRGLRDTILPVIVQYKTKLRASEEFVGLIRNGLGEGDFALEVIDAWTKSEIEVNKPWSCDSCGRIVAVSNMSSDCCSDSVSLRNLR